MRTLAAPSFFLTLLLAAPIHAQETSLVSIDSAGIQASDLSAHPSISADGRYVAFASAASNLVTNDGNGVADVFVRDRMTGNTVRASVSTAGVEGNGGSSFPVISADGRFVAFSSTATNLAGSDHNGGLSDVFVRDLVGGTTERISVTPGGAGGNALSYSPRISADGRFVLFHAYASDLVAGDAPGTLDVFVRDRQLGVTDGVSVGQGGAMQSLGSAAAAISADGRFVAYVTAVSGLSTVVLRDRLLQTTTVVSTAPGGPFWAYAPLLSADASTVVFSTSHAVVPQDQNFAADLYAFDVATSTFGLVSANLAGNGSNGQKAASSLSADGRYVAFVSAGADLVPGDVNGTWDVFLRDRALDKTLLVSVATSGQQGILSSTNAALSADGRTIAFSSDAPNLVSSDTNATSDIFVREVCPQAGSSNYGVGLAGTNGVPALTLAAPPALGDVVTLQIGNSSGVATMMTLILGNDPANAPTPFGGTLLVTPGFVATAPIGPAGATIAAELREDLTLCGQSWYAQVLIADPGAPAGLAFSAGLEIVPGN